MGDKYDSAQLPTHVAFKGDNGKLATAFLHDDGHQYLQFSSDNNNDEGVGNEVIPTINPNVVLIKNNYYGKFWRRSIGNWIWADAELNITDRSSIDDTKIGNDLLFGPISIGGDNVALRSLGNNCFCERHTADGKYNSLRAGVAAITKEARLQIIPL